MSFHLKSFLERESVHCVDIERVLSIVEKISSAGTEKLQVLSDFDRTLTQYCINGLPGATSHGIVECSSLVSNKFCQEAKLLKDKYHPLEISHSLTCQEKVAIMKEWWTSIHQLMINERISQHSLEEMVKEANVGFRDYHEQIMYLCEDYNIPLTVFSAGLADTIQLVFKLYSHLPAGTNVIGNKMIFDDNQLLVDFKQPLIHSFNKGVTVLDSNLLDKLKVRTNVILLGDSQGDPDMIKGLSCIDNIIKVGFLNHDENDLISIYERLYDIVLVGPDHTLQLPYLILKSIVN